MFRVVFVSFSLLFANIVSADVLDDYLSDIEKLAFLLVSNRNNPPTLAGENGALVDNALNIDKYLAAMDLGGAHSNTDKSERFNDTTDAYKFISKIYQRAFKADDKKYGAEQIRLFEMNYKMLIQTIGSKRTLPTQAAKTPVEADIELAIKRLLETTQKLVSSILKPMLNQQAKLIRDAKIPETVRKDAIASLKRCIAAFPGGMDVASSDEILKLAGANE